MEIAHQIGVVFGQCSQLWWDLPLSDSFDLHRRIYDIPPARLRENLERFSAMLDLTSFLDRAVLQLSLGQRSSEFMGRAGLAYVSEPPAQNSSKQS